MREIRIKVARKTNERIVEGDRIKVAPDKGKRKATLTMEEDDESSEEVEEEGEEGS